MDMSVSMTKAACLTLLTVPTLAQITDIIPDSLKGEENIDENLEDIWPRYITKDVEIIAQDQTENNDEGFWMTGKYSTVEQLTGELSFEIELTLNGPRLGQNWVYMMWLQAIDPYLTNPGRQFYEGFSCGMRYDSAYTEIPSNNLYPIVYRGTGTLQEALNPHDLLLVEDNGDSEQTKDSPWTINADKTVFVTDVQNGIYQSTCNFVRPYESEFSGIPLLADEVLELSIGYKAYASTTYTFPKAKGHNDGFVWVVAETPERKSAALRSLSAAAGALTLLTFVIAF